MHFLTAQDTKFLLIGILVGTLAGLLIGYIIWARTKDSKAALGELKWSQLIGAVALFTCILTNAPEMVTLAMAAMIPAETVALGIAGKVDKDKS